MKVKKKALLKLN